MVLTIHVVRQGGHHYYVHDLVPGRAEGGLVAGEEPGVWCGRRRRLPRTDRPGDVGCLRRRCSRDGTRALGPGPAASAGRPERGRLSTSPSVRPKSVSLLHLLAPREIAEAAGAGHHRPWPTPSTIWGGKASGSGAAAGARSPSCPTTGPVAGGFLHRTSRALDPHLHTHVVVANVAEGVDGVWSGVDGRRLHRPPRSRPVRSTTPVCASSSATGWGRPGSSVLRDSVTSSASTPGLRRLFSQRSASMDEHRHRRGAVRWPGAGPRSPAAVPRRPSGQGPNRHRGCTDGRMEAAGRRLRVRPR